MSKGRKRRKQPVTSNNLRHGSKANNVSDKEDTTKNENEVKPVVGEHSRKRKAKQENNLASKTGGEKKANKEVSNKLLNDGNKVIDETKLTEDDSELNKSSHSLNSVTTPRQLEIEESTAIVDHKHEEEDTAEPENKTDKKSTKSTNNIDKRKTKEVQPKNLKKIKLKDTAKVSKSRVKKNKINQVFPKNLVLCLKYDTEEPVDNGEASPSTETVAAPTDSVALKQSENLEKEPEDMMHLDLLKEGMLNVDKIDVMSTDEDSEDEEDTEPENVDATENKKDVILIEEKDNKLTFYKHQADKMSKDPEIEYLGEMKNNQIAENKTVKSEEMDTKYNSIEVKKEYEDKFKVQEERMTKQSVELNELKSLMVEFMNKMSKDKEPESHSKIKPSEKEDTDLTILSKIIDKTPQRTNILPESISVSPTELVDELTVSDSSSTETSRASEMNEVLKVVNSENVKITTTRDEVHNISDSEEEDVNKKDNENGNNVENVAGNSLEADGLVPISNNNKLGNKVLKTRKEKIFKNQNKDVIEDLEVYDANGEVIPLKTKESKNNKPEESLSPVKTGGASSALTSRMRILDPTSGWDRVARFTGQKSGAFVDGNSNKNVPDETWEKYSWADKYTPICSKPDIEAFLMIHEVEHLRDRISPWYCTIFPIDPCDRRYWTIVVDGEEYVSRARACTKPNYFRNSDPAEDTCLVCNKLLLTTFHVFMPVYKYEDPDTVDKVTIWKWQKSWLKICYLHFRRSTGVKFIPNRNPQRFGKPGSMHKKQINLPIIENKKAEVMEVPDEY